MPYSIFFRGGYAIHGTYATGALGRPASHGCVGACRRLTPRNSIICPNRGRSISITGAPSRSTRFASAHRHARIMLASQQRRGHAEPWHTRRIIAISQSA